MRKIILLLFLGYFSGNISYSQSFGVKEIQSIISEDFDFKENFIIEKGFTAGKYVNDEYRSLNKGKIVRDDLFCPEESITIGFNNSTTVYWTGNINAYNKSKKEINLLGYRYEKTLENSKKKERVYKKGSKEIKIWDEQNNMGVMIYYFLY